MPLPIVSEGLAAPPRQFFMCARDLAFWLRSAQTDHRLAQLQREHGTEKAFDLLYAGCADPWGYTVPHFRYQRLKYEKMLAILPARRYASALDIGCGLGVFTRLLAPHVDCALGMELSGVAVQQATALSQEFPNVHFAQTGIGDIKGCSAERYDLIVLADVLYYLSPLTDADLEAIVALMTTLLLPTGILLLANHYFFDLDPQSRRVREIHAAFSRADALELVAEQRHPFFLATVLKKQR